MDYQDMLIERFMRYAAITSQSKPGCQKVPSTPGQTEMAKVLTLKLTELVAK